MTSTEYELQIKYIEKKLEQLIEQYMAVKNENKILKARQETLTQEKVALMEKTNLAKMRVEAMISRLKAMEHDS